MKKTLTILIAVAVVLTVFLSIPPVEAQTKKSTAKSTEKKETAPKSTNSKDKGSDLTSAEKAELKEAQEILKQLNTYKKGQLTRLLNSGEKAELIALPSIGEATAERIIAARPLESSAHLVLIKGIGMKSFAEIVKARK